MKSRTLRLSMLAVALTLALGGCASLGGDTGVAKVAELGCDVASTSMDLATQWNNSHPAPDPLAFTKAQQDDVLRWAGKVGTVCLAPSPPTSAQLQDAAFQAAANGLKDLTDKLVLHGKPSP